MNEQRTTGHFSGETVANLNAAQLKVRLLRVAGGDPMLAGQLRAAIWQEYCAADRPFGPSEEGMLLWLAHGRRGRQQ